MDELSDADYLRDLAERLWNVPVMYGTDEGDVDRLREIAARLPTSPQSLVDPHAAGDEGRG